MLKVTNLKDTDNIKPIMLKSYIAKKITAFMNEYDVSTLEDIGCFIILKIEEFTELPISEMEFVELLIIGKKNYLHGVRIVSDNYGEEYILPIEVREI